MRDAGTGDVRLSVIIPTYNCKAYLKECLNSVSSQLPEDCEVIAVDDGSDDEDQGGDGHREEPLAPFHIHGVHPSVPN